jgi:DNA-binding LytR/AlgR family response regulator
LKVNHIKKTLDSNHFKRVGRSYLANMKKVTKLEGTTLYISEHYQIPISRRKKKLVLEYMKEVHH